MKRPLYLYVCERGFVLLGRPRPGEGDALFVTLDDCAVARKWGTTRGLGQLAAEGPSDGRGGRPATVLDREPDGTELQVTCVYRRIPCAPEAWSRWPS